MRTSMALATATMAGLFLFAIPACGPSAGDPCDNGDECGADLYCFDSGDGAPTCEEFPASCDISNACECDELLDQCDQSFACLQFGDITTLSCG